MKKRIIFLDIDGVLNCNSTIRTLDCNPIFKFIDTRKLLRLRELIKATGAEIVLSSSWRLGNLPDALWFDRECWLELKREFRRQGMDWIDETVYLPRRKRWREILAYLLTHDIDEFIIIDDEADELKPLISHTVVTNMKDGFNNSKLQEAIALFEKQDKEKTNEQI